MLFCACTSLAFTLTSANGFAPFAPVCLLLSNCRFVELPTNQGCPPPASVLTGVFPHGRKASHTGCFVRGVVPSVVEIPALSPFAPAFSTGVTLLSLQREGRLLSFRLLNEKFMCESSGSQQAVGALNVHFFPEQLRAVKAGTISGLGIRQLCARSRCAPQRASSCVSWVPLRTAAAPYKRQFLTGVALTGVASSKSPCAPPSGDAVEPDFPLSAAGNEDEVKRRCISGSAGVISITARARDRLRELKARESPGGERQGQEAEFFLRLGVQSGGCSGLSYVLNIIDKAAVASTDLLEKFEDDEGGSAGFVTVVVDPKSLLYVVGTVLDYSDDLIGGGFRVSNPNASRSCGCGMSFGVPKTFAQHLIDSKPQSCSTTTKKKTPEKPSAQ